MLELFKTECASKSVFTFGCLEQKSQLSNIEVYKKGKQCMEDKFAKLSEINEKNKIATAKTTSFILINHLIFTGSLKVENLFDAVCSAFITSPDQCLFVDNKYVFNQDYQNLREATRLNRYWIIVINVIVLVVLLCLAALAMIVVFGKIY